MRRTRVGSATCSPLGTLFAFSDARREEPVQAVAALYRRQVEGDAPILSEWAAATGAEVEDGPDLDSVLAAANVAEGWTQLNTNPSGARISRVRAGGRDGK